MSGVIKLVKKSAKLGDGFKSNEMSFVSTCFSLLLLNLSRGIADKKQLFFKDANWKIALQQVAQIQGSSERRKNL